MRDEMLPRFGKDQDARAAEAGGGSKKGPGSPGTRNPRETSHQLRLPEDDVLHDVEPGVAIVRQPLARDLLSTSSRST